MIAEKDVFIAQDILFNNQKDNCYYGPKFSFVMKMSWQWKGVFLFGSVYGLHEMYETECNYNVMFFLHKMYAKPEKHEKHL